MSDSAQAPDPQRDADQDVRLALSAVAAIQRLIEERNSLRDQIAAQNHELARLRRNLSVIRETYRRLTCEFVRQLRHIDGAIGDVQGTTESTKSRYPVGNPPNE